MAASISWRPSATVATEFPSSHYAKRPFGGPQAVLAYLSRYTHRVAIANRRLIACNRASVTFRWKDYRADGRNRQKVMTLSTGEFIRRFLIHVLPHTASTASATTACSPVARAPTTSPEPAACSTCPRHSPRPGITAAPRPPNPSRPRTRARAAAVAWSSSRRSSAALLRATVPQLPLL